MILHVFHKIKKFDLQQPQNWSSDFLVTIARPKFDQVQLFQTAYVCTHEIFDYIIVYVCRVRRVRTIYVERQNLFNSMFLIGFKHRCKYRINEFCLLLDVVRTICRNNWENSCTNSWRVARNGQHPSKYFSEYLFQ